MLGKVFEEWLAEGGAHTYDVQPATFPGELRGIKAIDTIQPVPKRLLFSASSARASPQFSLVVKESGPLTSLQVLAAYLIYELSKGADSFWFPYLKSLPVTYTCLSSFSAEEVEQLQVEHAQAVARAARQEVRRSHSAIKPLLASLGVPERYRGLAAARWALATLSSRTMFLEGDEAGVLMPFGDLHNHGPPPGPQLPDLGIDVAEFACCADSLEHSVHGDGSYDEAAGVYRLYARCRYEAGDQVLLCYGAHSNLDLLEHYGFVLDSNPHDAALLPIGALPDGLVRAGLQQKECWLHPCGVPSWDLLRALRIWAASHFGQGKEKHAAIEGRRISKESEALGMATLKAACLDVLDCLPTSAHADQELLEQADQLSEREVLAVKWRHLYKKSLLSAVDIAQRVTDTCG